MTWDTPICLPQTLEIQDSAYLKPLKSRIPISQNMGLPTSQTGFPDSPKTISRQPKHDFHTKQHGIPRCPYAESKIRIQLSMNCCSLPPKTSEIPTTNPGVQSRRPRSQIWFSKQNTQFRWEWLKFDQAANSDDNDVWDARRRRSHIRFPNKNTCQWVLFGRPNLGGQVATDKRHEEMRGGR